MGFYNGAGVMSDIIKVLKPRIPDRKLRKEIYTELIAIFGNHDIDEDDHLGACLCEDRAFDEAYDHMNAETIEDDGDFDFVDSPTD